MWYTQALWPWLRPLKSLLVRLGTDFLIDGRRIGLFRGARNTTGWRELGTQITPRGGFFGPWFLIILKIHIKIYLIDE